jgi:signal transduction histidine kinase/CheY-like chemotaxis protein
MVWQLRTAITEQDRLRFESAADNLHDTIVARIETYVAMLRAGAGLEAASDVLTRDEFQIFVDRLALRQRYPGVQGIGLTVRIPADRLTAFVSAQRRDRPEFRVWPEDPRDEYHAIVYLEPLDRRNAAAIGYDMFTDPTRRAAMEQARDRGEAAASGLVTLVQEIDESKQPGFLIYVPVYEGGRVPATVEERRARLRGFIYSPFRAGDLFTGILGRTPAPRVGFELFDGPPSEDALVHRTGSPDGARFRLERAVAVAGREWTASLFSTRALDESSGLAFLPLAVWSGVAVSLLLTGLALLQARARTRAEESEAAAAAASAHIEDLLGRERAARAEAERVSRMKDEFLAVLSHELRTPLNAVMGWAHLMKAGALPKDKEHAATDSILRNAQAQSRLIEDLLDMSRIISGRLALDITSVDIGDVIEAAATAVRPIASAKQITLTTGSGADSACVRGDAGRLQQIVLNLLTNAVKFTPSGGEVRVTVMPGVDDVEVAVSDTGAGIPREFLPYVFDRFRQADASFTRRHGGLGIGLSIVRSLVELHHGQIRVESDGSGRGATFTVTLPRADRAGLAADTASYPPRLATAANGRPLEGWTILVLDDDRDGRELAAEVLRQYGARVIQAATAHEALSRLEREGLAVDVLVSDIGLPEVDGFEFIARVRRAATPVRDVPAIALTAYASGEDRARALAAGYHLHLSKPLNPAALVNACLTVRTPREVM